MNTTPNKPAGPKPGRHSLRIEGRITCTTRDGVQIDFPILYDKPCNTDEVNLLRMAEGHATQLVELLIAQPFAMELVCFFRRHIDKILAEAARKEAASAPLPPTFKDSPLTFQDPFTMPTELPLPVAEGNTMAG